MESPSILQSKFHLGYRPSFDGIRGLAVLWVMAFHFNLPFGRQGLFGVDIFFVLSGFLITVLLMEEWERNGAIELGKFYLRRILRLYPALLILIIILSGLAPKAYIFSTLFYFTNWIKALHLQPDSLFLDHTWSLSIEEQYYILWPIALIGLLKTNISKKAIVLILFIIGLSSALARIVFWNMTHDWFRVYMGTDFHADGLLLGSLFGFMTVFKLLPNFSKHRQVVTLLTLLTFLLAIWLFVEKQLAQSFIPLYGNLGISLGTIVIISRIVNFPSSTIIKIFSFSPLVKVGKISYGLYLWHVPVGTMLDLANLNLDPSYLSAGKVILTFLAAGLSYWLVEKPFLRLKDGLANIQLGKQGQPKLNWLVTVVQFLRLTFKAKDQ